VNWKQMINKKNIDELCNVVKKTHDVYYDL